MEHHLLRSMEWKYCFYFCQGVIAIALFNFENVFLHHPWFREAESRRSVFFHRETGAQLHFLEWFSISGNMVDSVYSISYYSCVGLKVNNPNFEMNI